MQETPHPKTKQTERLLSTMTPANRPGLEEHCRYKVNNEDMSPNGLYSFARPLAHADEALAWRLTEAGWTFQGRPFRDARKADWETVVAVFRGLYSPEAMYNRVVNLRDHVRFLFGVENLKESELLGREVGGEMEKALKVARPEPQVVGVVIPEPDMDAMVESIPARNSIQPAFPLEVRDRACLRVLRASGHRVSEHVSVRLWGCQREVHAIQDATGAHDEKLCLTCGGEESDATTPVPVYKLVLPEDARDLKTGPRTIFIQDPKAVEALDAWLPVHPARDDPEAPLWIGGTYERFETGGDEPGIRQMATEGVRRLITKAVAWAKKAGHRFRMTEPEKRTPHDLRHTCATEKARRGWNEFQLCQYFGWRIGSPTPRVYVHLSLDDQRNLVLLAAKPSVKAPTTAPQMQALVGLLEKAMSMMGQATTSPTAQMGSSGATSVGAA